MKKDCPVYTLSLATDRKGQADCHKLEENFSAVQYDTSTHHPNNNGILTKKLKKK